MKILRYGYLQLCNDFQKNKIITDNLSKPIFSNRHTDIILTNTRYKDSDYVLFWDAVSQFDFFVYVLYSESQIIYVGMTECLKNRLQAHKTEKKFKAATIIPCESFIEMEQKEKALIYLLKPYQNKRDNPMYRNIKRSTIDVLKMLNLNH